MAKTGSSALMLDRHRWDGSIWQGGVEAPRRRPYFSSIQTVKSSTHLNISMRLHA